MTSASAFWDTTNGQIKYKPEGKLINVEEANLDAMSRFILFVENKCIASLVNRNRDEFMILARYMLYSKTHSTLINKATSLSLRSDHNEVECEQKCSTSDVEKINLESAKFSYAHKVCRLTACYNCVKRTIWECQAYIQKRICQSFHKRRSRRLNDCDLKIELHYVGFLWFYWHFWNFNLILMGFNCLQLTFRPFYVIKNSAFISNRLNPTWRSRSHK